MPSAYVFHIIGKKHETFRRLSSKDYDIDDEASFDRQVEFEFEQYKTAIPTSYTEPLRLCMYRVLEDGSGLLVAHHDFETA